MRPLFESRKQRERLKKLMLSSALSRKTKYFRRPLHVNGKPTFFKVVKLTEEFSIEEQLKPLVIWPEGECYLLPHVREFATNGFASPCDLVVSDRYGTVVSVIVRCQPDQVIDLKLKVADVWFFPPATATSLMIAPGQTISTKDTVVQVRK